MISKYSPSIYIRVTGQQHDSVHWASKKKGMTMASYCRGLILEDAERTRKEQLKKETRNV